MATDDLSRRISALENLNKQLLLRLQKAEGELKDLQIKHRTMKRELSGYTGLVSNRKFG